MWSLRIILYDVLLYCCSSASAFKRFLGQRSLGTSTAARSACRTKRLQRSSEYLPGRRPSFRPRFLFLNVMKKTGWINGWPWKYNPSSQHHVKSFSLEWRVLDQLLLQLGKHPSPLLACCGSWGCPWENKWRMDWRRVSHSFTAS